MRASSVIIQRWDTEGSPSAAYKSISGQLAVMKKWVDEADAMELEAK